MGRTCVVGNCDMQKILGISFHRIPATMLGDTRRKWIQLIQHSRNDPVWEPNGNERICGHHFNRWMELAKPTESEESESIQDTIPILVPQQPVRRPVPEIKPVTVRDISHSQVPISIVKPNLMQVRQRNGGSHSNSILERSTPPPPPLKKIRMSPIQQQQPPKPIEVRVNPNTRIMPAMPRLQPRRPPVPVHQTQLQRSNPVINRISNQITVTYVGNEEDDGYDQDQDVESYEESSSEGLPIPSCLVEAVFTEGSEAEIEDDEYGEEDMNDQPYFDNQTQVQINTENEFHFNSNYNPNTSTKSPSPPPPVLPTLKYPRMGYPDNSRYLKKFRKFRGGLPNQKPLCNGIHEDLDNSPNKLQVFNKILGIMDISPLKPKEGQTRPEIGNIAREKVNTLKSQMLEMIDVEDLESDLRDEYNLLLEQHNELMANLKTKYDQTLDENDKLELLDLIPESIDIKQFVGIEEPTSAEPSTIIKQEFH